MERCKVDCQFLVCRFCFVCRGIRRAIARARYRMGSRVLVGLLCLVLSASVGFCQDAIVAIVNNDAITQRDLDEFIGFTRMQQSARISSGQAEEKGGVIKEEALEKLIEDRLILQEAKKSSLKADEDRVKARLNDIKKRYDSDADFQVALTRQGVVEADIIKRIREQFLMQAFVYEQVRSRVTVSPLEVTRYYQAHKDEFREEARTDLDLFIAADHATAQDFAAALNKGGSREPYRDVEGVSHQSMSVQEGELRGDIDSIVRNMAVGEVSAPQALEGKYYVFRVTARTHARELSLSLAAERVRAVLYESKIDSRLKTYFTQLKSRAYVKRF